MQYKDESFKDEVGGVHDCGVGYNPHGVFCGECSSTSCKDCGNRDVKKSEDVTKCNGGGE